MSDIFQLFRCLSCPEVLSQGDTACISLTMFSHLDRMSGEHLQGHTHLPTFKGDKYI